MRKISILFFTLIFFVGCASSPLDRRQVVIYSEADMAAQGERSYRQMQQEVSISTNTSETNYVQCVSNYVIEALDPAIQNRNQWEVTLFAENQANAFALPGGKIGVYAGLLDVAINQHQLAAVLAHEVSHVIANHSNERASQNAIRDVGVAVARILDVNDTTLEAIDMGTRYGFFLPFNRTQESEADSIGIILMAEAGFDPEQSVELWLRMNSNGGPRPPEFMSTHPSPDSRISDLNRLMDDAQSIRQAANGRNPDCVPGIASPR
ncbi:MAG: M48 family metalloprotease [Pseudomonadales bacterium]|nr:M48 family metalloprotease [Pseudomonadales bacterium]